MNIARSCPSWIITSRNIIPLQDFRSLLETPKEVIKEDPETVNDCLCRNEFIIWFFDVTGTLAANL